MLPQGHSKLGANSVFNDRLTVTDRRATRLIPVALLCGLAILAAAAPAAADPGSCRAREGCKDTENWLDRSHSALSERTVNLASSLDRFFGVDDSAADAARSFVWVRLSGGRDHLDGSNAKLSIKGQWHLPRIDERLGLVFSDGDDENDSEADAEEGGVVGLRFEQAERARRGRLGMRVTLRSRGKLKTELRYRYTFDPLPGGLQARSTTSLWWQDGRGVGVSLGGNIEKYLSSRRLLRYSARVERAEDLIGAHWQQGLALNARLSLRDAAVLFTRFSGITQPDSYLQSVAVGARYRRQVLRQWMFVEVEPVLDWRRPLFEDTRTFSPGITLRMEWQLGEPVQLWQ